MVGRYLLRMVLILICLLSTTKEVWPQDAHDVFPAVVFLQGHQGVKKTTINGQEEALGSDLQIEVKE